MGESRVAGELQESGRRLGVAQVSFFWLFGDTPLGYWDIS